MLRYCANLKAIRYESTRLNRIVADKSHRVIVVFERRVTRCTTPDNPPCRSNFSPCEQNAKIVPGQE